MMPNDPSEPLAPQMGSNQHFQAFLFGDLTGAFEDDLRRLLHCKSNGTLQSLFDRVSLAYRQEFALLPADQQAWIPRFTNLVDLMANIDGTIGAPALRFSLLCVYQLGRFIQSDSYPDAATSYLVGICAGSFAAAAISSSRTMTELVTAGVEATLVAFRTGLHSLKMQLDMDPMRAERSLSWCFVTSMTEPKAVEILSKFSDEAPLSRSSWPYVSAVSPSTVTISGPPRSLERLIDSSALKVHSLPIQTPYHAAHLYELKDVDEVLGHLRDEHLMKYRPRIPLLSAVSGKFVEAADFHGLLRQAVEESLCKQVRWDKISSELSALAQRQSLKSCVVFPVGSNAAPLLSSALQKEHQLSVTISNALNTNMESIHTSPTSGKFQDSKIAIVGFSGRFPEAASNDELWEVLKAGRDCHRTIPEDRFDWEAHYDPEGKKKNHSRVKYGCFINDPGVFDAPFFNLSPREAENSDPAQRLVLMSAYEAMEMAGFVTDRTPSTQRDRVGVFFGTTSDDWREVNSGQDVDTYFIPGGNRAFVPGRISYFFRFSGPSISVDTACSSSFAAISTACSYLWQGDCDSAIAGGTNVLTNPDNFVGLDRGHFLSTTGNCNPFDNSASGYCRADAVGAVVLKRLEDAQADHDPIYGVIAGSSTNHCGQTVSITRPHEGDQLSLFNRILRQTNTNPTDISYVEMHGTGTQAGDATEMRSVLSAFAWDDGRASEPRRPLHLGAIKANVGHAESASGVTALIKVLLMMKHSEIPPQRLDGELNHNYPADMADRNVHIPFKATKWHREDCPSGKRMSFLNNFSAAGGNTAILLEDAPRCSPCVRPADPRNELPVTVTGKTAKALANNLRVLIDYLESNPSVSLPALSYTTTARRTHYKFRMLVSGSDITAIKAALKRRADDSIKAIKATPPKLAFVFTGQGTFYTGAGKKLFNLVPSFRDDILRFDSMAQRLGFSSFIGLIADKEDVNAQTIEPIAAQLAIVCVQMALSHLWNLWVGRPSSVTGHSLGEYAALYTSGVLSASDIIHLVGSRAQLLEKYCTKWTHSMLAIKAPLGAVALDVSKTGCAVACINSPTSVVASGPISAIQQLSELLKSKKTEIVTLDVPYAFHSAQVEPILAEYESLASAIQFQRPTVPYISPLLAKTVSETGILDASYLTRATRDTVNFQGAIEAARAAKLVDDHMIWIEIGTHPVCSGMVKQTVGSHAITAPTLRKDVSSWKVLIGSIETLYQAGIEIQWNEFHRGFEAGIEVISLPRYQWDLKNYWIQYRYNFCLTKGDDPATFATSAPSALLSAPDTQPSLSSSVHRVLEENNSADISTILIESDLHDPRLFPILSGHKVNTAMLCPSSLYGDMALTIAKQMLRSNGLLNDKVGLDCSAMNIQNPLIARPDAECQLLRVSAKGNWSLDQVSLSFFSVDANARKLANHASCTVKITKNQNWIADWKRNAYLITSRISSLRDAVDSGSAHKLKRGLAYKLFSTLVDYGPNYQGMEQVVLDSGSLEATAQIKFQVEHQGFDLNPCWIDSLGHIAGFIMNGNDNVHSKDQVFINHGWEAMRCAKPIVSDKTYTSYNRMQLEDGTMYVGDTYVFQDQELIAIFQGVRFQGVNRSVLDHLLPGKAKGGIAKATPKATPVAQPAKRATAAALEKTPSASAPKAKAAASSQPQPSKPAEALKIIAEEVQIEMDELDMDAEFADYGIDSLLSLTISSRLRDELDIDVPSSAFVDYVIIKDFFSSIGGKDSSLASSLQSPESISDDQYESDTTAATSLDEDNGGSDHDIMATIRKVIAEETGTAMKDISSDSLLVELGVDSLLSLTITSTLAEDLDAQPPSSIFIESETLGDIETALCESGLISKPSRATPAKTGDKNPFSGSIDLEGLEAPPHATSAVLSGYSKTAKTTLFLFPDGAGSATSYQALPGISPEVVVFGLNCPWLKTPQDLKCSLEHYVAKLLIEVQRRQPKGPYNFGGVSAGGILAYEAAQQLERKGEKVARLILMDSPDPVGLENPNQRMYDFLDSLGMFGMGNKSAPKWLRPHFDAFLVLLDAYEVKEFVGSSPPATHMIYARDGMCKHETDPCPEIRPDDPREMRWLLNNRTDFSGAGWVSLLGKDSLHISVLDDVNHYTIMWDGPRMKELAALIARALITT